MKKIVKSYAYIYDIFKLIIENSKMEVPEIHTFNLDTSGSRYSGKSINAEEIPILELCMIMFGVSATIWRYEPQGATETFDELCATTSDLYNIEVDRSNSNMSRKRLRINGNTINVRGFISNRKNDKPRLGVVRKGIKKVIQINAVDEVSEFPEERDVELIKQASGGSKIVLNIMATNPWVWSHWYTKKLARRGVFNEQLLREKGEVFLTSFDKEKKTLTITHITNHRINTTLSEAQHQSLTSTWDLDPNFARVVDLGLPGMQEGLVYNSNLHNLQPLALNAVAEKYVVGLDWGTAQGLHASATHACMGYIDKDFKGFEVNREFRHSNKGGNYWDDNRIVQEVLRDTYSWLSENKWRIELTNKKVEFRYDWAAMTLGTLLANEWQNMKRLGVFDYQTMELLNFRPCTKYSIPTRINAFNSMIAQRRVRIDPKITPHLYAELESCQWEPTRLVKGQATRIDGNDDGINAWEYMISDDLFSLVDKRFIDYYKK